MAAYAFSPIDLIPDFIPLLGIADDLLIVAAGIWLALRLIPDPLMEEFRAEAQTRADRPVSHTGAILVVALWLAAIALTTWLFFEK